MGEALNAREMHLWLSSRTWHPWNLVYLALNLSSNSIFFFFFLSKFHSFLSIFIVVASFISSQCVLLIYCCGHFVFLLFVFFYHVFSWFAVVMLNNRTSMNSTFQGPPQPGQPFKFTVGESCDRIKEEFNFLQAQYHK